MGVVVRLPTEASPGRAKTEQVAFTEQRVEKLCERKPKAGARYIFDKKAAGLCIRLTPANAKYVFYKWHKGRPGRITIAKVGTITLQRARDIAVGYHGDLAREIDVFTRARAEKARPKPATLADAFQAHVARPDMHPSTRRDYTSL